MSSLATFPNKTLYHGIFKVCAGVAVDIIGVYGKDLRVNDGVSFRFTPNALYSSRGGTLVSCEPKSGLMSSMTSFMYTSQPLVSASVALARTSVMPPFVDSSCLIPMTVLTC